MRKLFRFTIFLGMIGGLVAVVRGKKRTPAEGVEGGPEPIAGHATTSGESDQSSAAAEGHADTSGSSDAPAAAPSEGQSGPETSG